MCSTELIPLQTPVSSIQLTSVAWTHPSRLSPSYQYDATKGGVVTRNTALLSAEGDRKRWLVGTSGGRVLLLEAQFVKTRSDPPDKLALKKLLREDHPL